MTLRVYLHNKFCGKLQTTSDRGIIFSYEDNYLNSTDVLPLSISLPLQKKEFSQKECLPYFSGLLPEGEIKRQISNYLHISQSSTIKLLEALGGECAGTVVLNSEDEAPLNLLAEYELNEHNYRHISDKELASSIENKNEKPLLFSQKDFRLSLTGAQQKIALAYINNEWFIPKGNAPSTHIIKPSRIDFTDIAQNEYISMQIAKIFLDEVPETFMQDLYGNEVFCIKRFDRIQSGNKLKRVHQEDMCQALGIMNDKKYQADGGPSVKDIVNLLKQKSSNPLKDTDKLLRSVIFQYLIGNCDAHGKNYSLREDSNNIILSPLYDIVSTVAYPSLSKKLSMKIGNEYELDKISFRNFSDLANVLEINISIINKIFDDFENKIALAEKFIKENEVARKNSNLVNTIWTSFLDRFKKNNSKEKHSSI